jgi:molybdenum cofactor synthesis domain
VLRADQKRYLKLEPLSKVFDAIRKEVKPLGTELVPTEDALDRICAKNYRARWDVPPFDVSAMDGYAFRYSDLFTSRIFLVKRKIFPSTKVRRKIKKGEACYVATGSPLPLGADTVARVEQTRVLKESKIEITRIEKAKNVSRKGEDIKKGEIILQSGKRINPASLSLLVYYGIRRVRVYKKPKTGVLSIGDELCEFKQKQKGKLYNNYAYLVLNYLKRLGFDVMNFGVCQDQNRKIAKIVAQALKSVDVLFTIGGTSVGLKDQTPDALSSLSSRFLFHGVRVVPIKPAGVAKLNQKYVVLLPAHPVSLVLSFHVIAIPVLSLLSGCEFNSFKCSVSAILEQPIRNERNIDALYLVTLTRKERELVAKPLEWGSNLMSNVMRAQGFVLVKAHEELKQADRIEVELLGAQELMGVCY